MVDLVPYAAAQAKKGVSIGKIRKDLKSRGYDREDIVRAVSSINKQHKHALNLNTSMTITIILVCLLAVFIYFNTVLKSTATTSSFDVTLINSQITSGEALDASILLETNSKELLPGKLIYKIFNDRASVLSFEESFEMLSKKSIRRRFDIPNTIRPGTYTLSVIFYFNDHETTKDVSFTVLKEGQLSVEKPTTIATTQSLTTFEDFSTIIVTTTTIYEEFCHDGILNQDEEEVDCGGICEACTKSQREITIGLVNKTRDEKMSFCITLSTDDTRDNCFRKLSRDEFDAIYCEAITVDAERDKCLMWFATKYEYRIDNAPFCNLITDKYNKKTCELLYKNFN